MSSVVFRRFVNGSLSLAFLIPARQLIRHLFRLSDLDRATMVRRA